MKFGLFAQKTAQQTAVVAASVQQARNHTLGVCVQFENDERLVLIDVDLD
jgi:hypothetical protein